MLTKARLVELLEAERESHRLERMEWARERAELTNKIIAPQEAAAKSLNGDTAEPIEPLTPGMGPWTVPPPEDE